MDVSGQGGRVVIRIVGRMYLHDRDGTEIVIKARRSRGILAMLALSPDMNRSRSALQEFFWPNRLSAAGSLKTELYNLKKDLGSHGHILRRDGDNVWLSADDVEVDLQVFDAVIWAAKWGNTPPQLMEDIDLDHDFDHWRLEQQLLFETRFEQALAARKPVTQQSGRPVVRIRQIEEITAGDERFATLMIAEMIWRALREHGGIDLTGDANREADLEITLAVRGMGNDTHVVLFLTDTETGLSLWTAGRNFPGKPDRCGGTPAFRLFINEAAFICAAAISRLHRYEHEAVGGTLRAIDIMFRLQRESFHEADSKLAQSFEIDSNGVHLAWRAYLRSFIAGEGTMSDIVQCREEATEFTRQTLECAPDNSLALALLSHVQSYVMRDPEYGHDLAEMALTANPSNALAMAYLGRAKAYLGDHENGYRLAASARGIVGPVPYRYTIDFICGATALLSGRPEEAIRMGEMSLRRSPGYQAPMRYLLPLYCKRKDHASAHRIYDSLRNQDPSFSIRQLKEQSYPTAAVRESGLLELDENDFG